MFCDLCGGIITIKKINGGKFGFCNCGFVKEAYSDIKVKSKFPEQIKKGEGVVNEDISKEGFPHKCKKCSFDYCEIYDLGASYSDESNVYLFKCKKCGFVERQADGSSNN